MRLLLAAAVVLSAPAAHAATFTYKLFCTGPCFVGTVADLRLELDDAKFARGEAFSETAVRSLTFRSEALTADFSRLPFFTLAGEWGRSPNQQVRVSFGNTWWNNAPCEVLCVSGDLPLWGTSYVTGYQPGLNGGEDFNFAKVAPIPLPASGVLAASGIMLLGVLRRIRSKPHHRAGRARARPA